MPRKMRSSFGCVQRLDKNRYRLRWWEDDGCEYKRRTRMVHGTRREAERAMAEIRAGLDETKRRRVAIPTVGEAYEKWARPLMLRQVEEGRTAASTQRMRESAWNTSVGPRWSDVKVTEVRALDVQRWLDGMTQKPASRALTLLRLILDQAALYEVVEYNVARRAYTMPVAHKEVRDGAYSLEELDRIARAAEGSPCEAAMILSMFGSARTGESLGVRLSEVTRDDYEGLPVTVAQVVRQVRSGGELSADGTLKNPQSVRPLVIPPPWGDRLWEVAEKARAVGDEWLSDDGLGRPITPTALRKEWAKACKAAGVEQKQPRAARRSWETYMRWDMGVEQSRIEQMMGHALPGVTGAHYDKPTARMFVQAVGEAVKKRPFVRKVEGA